MSLRFSFFGGGGVQGGVGLGRGQGGYELRIEVFCENLKKKFGGGGGVGGGGGGVGLRGVWADVIEELKLLGKFKKKKLGGERGSGGGGGLGWFGGGSDWM